MIPIDGPLGMPCKGNAVLIGDAAGFVNPLTGEGIYSGVRSGQIAADSIINCKGNLADLRSDTLGTGSFACLEKECNVKLEKIKLNTKLRDEVLTNSEAMENYVKRLEKLG